MPTLTCTISDADLELLEKHAAQLQVTPTELAEAIIQRNLRKAADVGRANAQVHRIIQRSRRQLALLHHLKTLPPGTKLGQMGKRELAEQWGVDERTLYRDFDAIEALIKTEGEAQTVATLELSSAVGIPVEV